MPDSTKTILTIIGARPQWMKAAALSRELRGESWKIKECYLHTGQHVSDDMSGQFFKELGLPDVDFQLHVDADPAIRMGQMMKGTGDVISELQPDAVLLYGDTDSTLAGAWAAARAHVPVIHVEAGLRSFDRKMPEEINRILTDQIGDLLFCPSRAAELQLQKEGIFTGARQGLEIHVCGDLMLDTARHFGGVPRPAQGVISKILLTMHRPSNVDDEVRLLAWFQAMGKLAMDRGIEVIFPVHPRTQKMLVQMWGEEWEQQLKALSIRCEKPAGYLQMMQWLQEVDAVWTDSGGLQKEAFFMHRPSLVLRSTSEWVELIDEGFASLCPEPSDLPKQFQRLEDGSHLNFEMDLYGTGQAAADIVRKLNSWLRK